MDRPTTLTTKRWFPLESNPTLMNQYVEKLGFSTVLYEFVDVFSTESWALEMISPPVAAVLMSYPYTPIQKSRSAKEDNVLDLLSSPSDHDEGSSCWFVKQRIRNACGTIGLLHALFNTPEGIRDASIQPQSWLDTYYRNCPIPLNPMAKAELLEQDSTIETLHDDATSSSSNQTNRGEIEDKVLTHFVALVHVNGQLLELDGRKDGPVLHGTTNEMNLLQDACHVVQKFMKRDPDQVKFTILALAPKQYG